jgi:hypothetical protein
MEPFKPDSLKQGNSRILAAFSRSDQIKHHGKNGPAARPLKSNFSLGYKGYFLKICDYQGNKKGGGHLNAVDGISAREKGESEPGLGLNSPQEEVITTGGLVGAGKDR